MSKKELRKAGKRGQHTSLHVTITYDIENEDDQHAYGKYIEPKDGLINALTSEIDRQLEFIAKKMGKKKPVDNKNIHYGMLLTSITKDKTLNAIPYLRLAAHCAWELDSVRRDLLNRDEVDSLAISMAQRIMSALVSASMREVANYEDKYFAGTSKTSEASQERTREKERLIKLVTPWKETYESQKVVTTKNCK